MTLCKETLRYSNMTSPFSQICIWDDNSIFFKNLHFETCFQKFAFSSSQNFVVV